MKMIRMNGMILGVWFLLQVNFIFCNALNSNPISATQIGSNEATHGGNGASSQRIHEQQHVENRSFSSPTNFQPRSSTKPVSTALSAARRRRYVKSYYMHDDNNGVPMEHDEIANRQRFSTDRPTMTDTPEAEPEIIPSKPKIVVLGASGKIGRLVVRQLLEMSNLDATIVAFCRDYDKACRVLYDDILVARNQRKGPKLQIIEGDLVPPEELPGYRPDDEEEEERNWMKRAKSAAAFYGNKLQDYDNRDENEPVADEALEEAIKGCTTIINCVGSVRPTNVWTDFLARPFLRLLRKDVSSWCKDPRHPFYVHYQSTKKSLRLAEKEQLKREAVASADTDGEDGEEMEQIPRIRFIRISDLVCAQQPWNFVPLFTNIMHSMVFRYQDMAEKAMEASSLVETVTLRPGDLVDDERDVETTSLQIDPSGSLPSPARIGRDDVAALAVSAALFDFKADKNSNEQNSISRKKKEKQKEADEPFHFTLACRWAGENMSPYPAQGKMSDGHSDANTCFRACLETLQRQEKRNKLLQDKSTTSYPKSVLRIADKVKTHPRKTKPYGVCVAIPVYTIIVLLAKSLLRIASPYIPVKEYLIPIASKIIETSAAAAALLPGLFNQIQTSIFHLTNMLPRSSMQKYIKF